MKSRHLVHVVSVLRTKQIVILCAGHTIFHCNKSVKISGLSAFKMLTFTQQSSKQNMVKTVFCPVLSDARQSVGLYGGSHAPAACPSKCSIDMKMSMDHWRSDTNRGDPKVKVPHITC